MAYTGPCVLKDDDFDWLDNKILDSDGVIVVVPSYEKTVPSEYKAMMDRMGPSHDVTIAEVFTKRREKEDIQDGRSIDPRMTKHRPIVFIGHGGRDESRGALNLPLQKLWALPMGFQIIDEKYFPWNVTLRLEDDKLTEIRAGGKNLGESVVSGNADYVGPAGICPYCHSREFQLKDLAKGEIECLICGVPGKLESDGAGGLKATFKEEDKKYSLVTDEGRLYQLKDIILRGGAPRDINISALKAKSDSLKDVLVPVKPE